jgi:hypothetical protein
MKIKKINELFDNEELRNELEVSNIKGDLDLDSDNWKNYSNKFDSENWETFISKIIYKYPILSNFHKKFSKLDDIILVTYYASTKEDIDDKYYGQLSLTYDNNIYYSNTIFKLLDEMDVENFITNEYSYDDIENIYIVIDSFLKTCNKLGILNKKDLEKNTIRLN